MAAPDSAGEARLRVAYYFRDAVVQSQLLTAEVAERHGTGTWSLRTDYTITDSLPGVADIPARPRVAVVLNGDGSTHEIYMRARPLGRNHRPRGYRRRLLRLIFPRRSGMPSGISADTGERAGRADHGGTEPPSADHGDETARPARLETIRRRVPRTAGHPLLPGDGRRGDPARGAARRGPPERALGPALHDEHRFQLRARL